ncbi:MAG TPA: phosphatase PAP2 family protein [Tepidiformaceae bacterium]|nr:phosphatase PAP2 family protein [Tepidiformaceae bacterium]
MAVVTPAPEESERPHAGAIRWRVVAAEMLGTAVMLVLYFLLRGIRPADVEGSVSRSLQLIWFEQRLGVFQEVHWQAFWLDHSWAMRVANVVYAWFHYPVMLVIGIWLLLKDPVRFRFVRNVMFVSAAVGVVSYWVLPAAPPRLMESYGYDYGFIDTVHGPASNVNYFQPGPFVNDLAALPSFHFGWILLSSMAVWHNTASRAVRGFAILMSVVMWWAVTVTGNHYFFDMVMGGVVVVLSWMFVSGLGDVHLRDVWVQARRVIAGRKPRPSFERSPLPGAPVYGAGHSGPWWRVLPSHATPRSGPPGGELHPEDTP